MKINEVRDNMIETEIMTYSIDRKSSPKKSKKIHGKRLITEINDKKVEIKKLPGKRVERKDDPSIEMYNHALEVINEIQTAPTRQTTKTLQIKTFTQHNKKHHA